MAADDLRLVHEWLQRPHVQRWWRRRESYEQTVSHYLPAIEGTEPTRLYIALCEEEPIGFVQTYLVSSYPGYAKLVDAREGVAGMDLLIGDEELTGQNVQNVASIRAFEKAGFRIVDDIVDPEDGEDHFVVRRER